MKKWLIFSAVFILAVSLVLGVFMLWKSSKPFYDIRGQAEELTLQSKALAVVTDSYTYNGKSIR